ncbi:MAG: phosphocholine cytidylyltransferase family protein [Coxiellaceae bacterium]|nr:phosphocholine cytidylyltransferase family protein [Coxiellaceae bacterium]
MKAVILAAGQGIRIRDHHELPKGFIEIEGQTIIQQSLDILHQHGIKDILMVTGYSAEYYVDLAKQTGQFEVAFNPHFADYASLYSLYCAKNWVDEDFVILESDILYEARAIEQILQAPQANITLVSGATQSSDEIYVEADKGQLINMSKQWGDINKEHFLGEFVGISKMNLASYQLLVELLDKDQAQLQQGCYEEQGLVTLAQHAALHCHKIDDLAWCEIDNLFHLQRAQRLYAKIRSLETESAADKQA